MISQDLAVHADEGEEDFQLLLQLAEEVDLDEQNPPTVAEDNTFIAGSDNEESDSGAAEGTEDPMVLLAQEADEFEPLIKKQKCSQPGEAKTFPRHLFEFPYCLEKAQHFQIHQCNPCKMSWKKVH